MDRADSYTVVIRNGNLQISVKAFSDKIALKVESEFAETDSSITVVLNRKQAKQLIALLTKCARLNPN